MLLNVKALAIATLGLLLLSACSSNNQPTTSNSSVSTPAAKNPSATPSDSPEKPEKLVKSEKLAKPELVKSETTPAKTTVAKAGTHGGQGGQVIESGPYHLELLTVNEADGTHIDFFLQKGDHHQPISNAKVTAQVQLPDGNQKPLTLKYDTSGKHYYAVIPAAMVGDYKIVILTNINGEKINGRFSFSRS